MSKAKRPQLQRSDVNDPERLYSVLNEIFLAQSLRIEALENLKGVYVLPELEFETSGALTPNSAPFSTTAGGLRLSCPFPPTGLILLNLQPARSMAISSLSSDVKWHYAAGPGAGDGVLHIDFVTGLLINTRYKMRVGVTRA